MEPTSSLTKLEFGTKSPQQLRVVFIELKGEATLRILDVDPPSLNWEREDVNGVAQAKTVTLSNSSSQAQRVFVSMKEPDGSPFSANVNGSSNSIDIPAQGSVPLTVLFRPDKAGEVTGEVQIKLQDASTPEVTLPVKGVGQFLTGRGGGCSATGMGSASLLAMLTLLGLHSRRRRRE
ncbi:MYXO-CTERM sorting domain-containing protein [Archangium gephyra]|uniref:MYXO-CTERM sorting domain-containing protein n=1 Tax=Archangium gephyra TaxID=48 RepID=UPI003B8292D9